jgi:hypothetical protein
MNMIRPQRIGLIALASLVTGACASSAPDVFQRQARASARMQLEAATADRSVCPVVVSNATDHHLDASYALQGERSVLGLIPAGRSLAIEVRCTAGRIEAFATAPGTGFLGGPEEYRTVAALDRTRETRVRFTLTDRVN